MADKRLSVVLIDDESLTREHVRRSVDWGSLGMEIVGEAADGVSGLKLIRDCRPAIAIVDINMPNLNGIVLSERIRSEQPDCKIIILSGFNEFEYAKKALRAGVLEYMLKPLKSDELEAALSNAKKAYLEDLQQRNYIKNLEHRITKPDEKDSESIFTALITDSNLVNDSKSLFVQPSSVIVLVSIDGSTDRWPDTYEQIRWHKALIGFLSEDAKYFGLPVVFGPDGLPVFVCTSIRQAFDRVGMLQELVLDRFGFTVSAGISEAISSYKSLRNSYLSAKEALELRFFEGCGYLGVAPVATRVSRVLLPNKADITLPLRMGNIDAIIRTIESNSATIIEEKIHYNSVELMVMEMMAAASQFLTELDIELDPLLEENGSPWRQIVKSRETLKDLESWLIHAFQVVLGRAKKDVRFKTYKVVDRAMDFIKSNYTNYNLTLRTIADAVNINPSYLSKIFKLQTGFSVIEYLRETRLNEAKELFGRSPRSMVFEVAEAVGFTDPLYFSKVFKSRFGVSPKKFRR